MTDHAILLDRIEQAIHRQPFCTACGAATRIREADDALWLECSTLQYASGPRWRRAMFMGTHEHRLIVELPEDAAA